MKTNINRRKITMSRKYKVNNYVFPIQINIQCLPRLINYTMWDGKKHMVTLLLKKSSNYINNRLHITSLNVYIKQSIMLSYIYKS